ncbi:MAG: type II secretion system protein [Candidatus Shapirobacteria bacterium]|nr:type II secretion system protein [Candidatus Shapirobacteria bacterium]MDD3002320.1 type II secretion system protein [Candidatus Shapirobacteria bacterium]MDD4382675.1 type II secretion system protein [Candidatus Shapirobacteria bacterium]
MNKKNGFTLIELIVTVTIIAILTVMGMISYSGTTKKARDNRRMADLEKIRIALELYRQGTGSSYPADGTLSTKLVPNYLQALPIGPKGENYAGSYDQTGTGYTYIITTTLEETGVGYSVTNP